MSAAPDTGTCRERRRQGRWASSLAAPALLTPQKGCTQLKSGYQAPKPLCARGPKEMKASRPSRKPRDPTGSLPTASVQAPALLGSCREHRATKDPPLEKCPTPPVICFSLRSMEGAHEEAETVPREPRPELGPPSGPPAPLSAPGLAPPRAADCRGCPGTGQLEDARGSGSPRLRAGRESPYQRARTAPVFPSPCASSPLSFPVPDGPRPPAPRCPAQQPQPLSWVAPGVPGTRRARAAPRSGCRSPRLPPTSHSSPGPAPAPPPRLPALPAGARRSRPARSGRSQDPVRAAGAAGTYLPTR